MPSRADWRRSGEWLLRLALMAMLALALWRSVRASRTGAVVVTARASTLGDALERATTSGRVGVVGVEVDASLGTLRRDWLVALRRAGARVQWYGTPPAIAIAADRAREPAARVRMRVVSNGGDAIVISDSVGVVDSMPSVRGAAFEASDVVGAVIARRGAFAALTRVPAREERRAVLVLGRAGWESRFVLAALGEAGWIVRGRLPVAPGVSVTDASVLPIDTSRYDAVIALDSTAADLAPAVGRFVAQGGGVIAAGSALGIDVLRGLVPARAGARRPARILLEGDTLTRADLALRPLTEMRADAVVLERQLGGLAVAIRRAGRGRAAAVGYDESWRWRMQGGPGGEGAHREWWSRMVGLVAPAREPPDWTAAVGGSDAAPRAALITALGPPSDAAPRIGRPDSTRLPLALLALIAFALLAETASRRFRGTS